MNDLLDFVGNSQWPLAPQNIENSTRFNDGSSDYLSRTPSSAGNRKTWTWSGWVKRGTIGANSIFEAGTASNNSLGFQFESGTDNLQFFVYNGSSVTVNVKTTQVFRDLSAWYHIVVAFDTTQGTASNRVKLYVNGSQVTDLASTTYPSQDTDYNINNTNAHELGRAVFGSSNYFDGYMAEVVFIDGQALDPTSFGEFDSTTGIWKPKKIGQQFAAGGGAGTNGFYLDFKDSSNLGNDASGNNNDYTVNNLTSVDQSTDTCTNNFCTLNPLASGVAIGGSDGTFADGNLFFSGASSAWCATKGTFSVTQGKWYMEAKKTTNANGTSNGQGAVAVGFAELQSNLGNDNPQNDSDVYSSILVINDNGWTTNFANGTQWSTPLAVNDGDIVGIALDLDGNNYIFYVNGSQVDTGSLGGGYDGNGLTPCVINYGGDTREFTCNFGSPSFTISSGNSDANGFGNFEYSVPSGYYALNTSNLNTYG
jgi:hypothetical protein